MKKECTVRSVSRVPVYLASACVIVGLCCMMCLCLAGCEDRGTAVIISGGDSDLAPESGELSDSDSNSPSESDDIQDGSVSSDEEEVPTSDESGTASSVIYVHICGEVNVPGVYELPAYSRVWDAVEAAGGLSGNAAPEAVNLAVMLEDGCKVTIPSESEAAADIAAVKSGWYEKGVTDGEIPASSVYENEEDIPETQKTQTAAGSEESVSSGMNGSGTDESGRVNINEAGIETLATLPGIGESKASAIVDYRERYGPFSSIEDIMLVTGIKEGLFTRIRDYITVGG